MTAMLESAVAAQHAEGEAKHPEEDVEEGRAGVAMLFFRLARVRRSGRVLGARFSGGQSALDIFFDGEFQVRSHFGVEIASS